MDFALFFQALLALLVVIGFVFLLFGGLKFLETKGLVHFLGKKMRFSSRLTVVESKRLDVRNTLVLVRCDKEEYLLLLGNSQNLLLQTKKVGKDV